jgi:hypothetical protein
MICDLFNMFGLQVCYCKYLCLYSSRKLVYTLLLLLCLSPIFDDSFLTWNSLIIFELGAGNSFVEWARVEEEQIKKSGKHSRGGGGGGERERERNCGSMVK